MLMIIRLAILERKIHQRGSNYRRIIYIIELIENNDKQTNRICYWKFANRSSEENAKYDRLRNTNKKYNKRRKKQESINCNWIESAKYTYIECCLHERNIYSNVFSSFIE